MTLQIAPGWELDVDRGPEWLFVRIRKPSQDASDTPQVAEQVWTLLQQHSICRLVLEMEQIEILRTYLIGQLVLLHKRISVCGGTMRLCGLSSQNQQVLRLCRLNDRFLPYSNREEAVMGRHPRQ